MRIPGLFGSFNKSLARIQPPILTLSGNQKKQGAGGASLVAGTQCRLNFVSATEVRLDRFKGSYLWISGRNEQVPAAGVSLSNSGLSASTVYYVYGFMSAGAMTLEASTTAPLVLSTDGTSIKGADSTRALVGRVVANASSQFVSDFTSAWAVVSWHNPRRIWREDLHFFGPIAGLGYAVPDGTGNGVYAFLTGTTASASNHNPLGGTARILRARFHVVWAANTTVNKIRLVHADDGPANITQIAEFTSTNGGVASNFTDVQDTLNTLMDGLTTKKNLLFQVDKTNATTLTLYEVVIEFQYESDPW